MQVSTLLLGGGISALLFVLYSGSRIVTKRSGTTVPHILLAFVTIALVFAALVRGDLARYAGTDRIALGIAGLLVVVGAIAAALEWRRQTQLNQVSGLVVTGTGILLGVMVFVTPLTVSQIQASQEPRTVAAPTAALQSVAWVTQATVTPQPTNQPQNTAVIANRRTFSLTPLPTQYVAAELTATPEAAEVETSVSTAALCAGTVQNNLNLRAGAGSDTERLTTIPYATRLNVSARSADNGWLAVSYDGQSGWVSAEYVVLDAGCGTLPQRSS